MIRTLPTILFLVLSPIQPIFGCGGFFCSQSAPIDQASEQILFSIDNNEVTAHIRIQYQGPSEKFSWILPLPTPPRLDVGSNTFFDRLQQRTRPQFMLLEQRSTTEGQQQQQCNAGWIMEDDMVLAEAADGGAARGGSTGEVLVVDQGQVGPFDFVLLLALSGNPTDVVNWLNDNHFDQPEGTADLLQSYAEYNFTFLALRMSKNKSSGDIQPLVVKYKFKEGIDALSCIPLKLTKVAAVEDMPVYVWVFSANENQRAVPVNFLDVQMDWTKFDWMNCATNRGGCIPCDQHYLSTVSSMVDVADGHGFITEYAGNLDVMKDWLYIENVDVDELKKQKDVTKFLDKMLEQGFPRDSVTQEIIKKWIPKPTQPSEGCKEDREFYASWNIEKCIKDMPSSWKWNPQGMANDLDNRIMKPLKAAEKLVSGSKYLSRLFTTISPSEMTSDPLFVFDTTLGDVPLQVSVNATITCDEGPNDLDVAFKMGEKHWKVFGTYDGCQFKYKLPLTDGNVNRPEPLLFKRTGDSSTSGQVARADVTVTLLEMEKLAMDLMPDNEWTEIPDNSHFKESGNEGGSGGSDSGAAALHPHAFLVCVLATILAFVS